MGEELYEKSYIAKSIFYEASEATEIDLVEACFGSQTETLDETVVAQPAIAAVALSNYYYLSEKGFKAGAGEGHSAGELTLLAIAGSLAVRDTFGLIKARADAMLAAHQERPGRMAVVQNLTAQEAREALAELLETGRLFLTNLNTSLQNVLSGDVELLEEAKKKLRNLHLMEKIRKTRFGFLPIQIAAHSPYHMAPAVEPFTRALQKVKFEEPDFKIMLNNARYLHELGTDNLPDYLAGQLVNGVDFVGGTNRLIQDGLTKFVDLGEKPILSDLVVAEHGNSVDILQKMDHSEQ